VADALVARLRTMQATSTSPLIFPAPLGGFLHHFQDHFREAVRASLKMVERYAHGREGRDAEVMRQMGATRAAWERQAQVPTKTPRMRRVPRNA
jgi:hypothetical protein